MARKPVRYWLVLHAHESLPAMGLSRELSGRWTIHPNLSAQLTMGEAKKWQEKCGPPSSIIKVAERPYLTFTEYVEAHQK